MLEYPLCPFYESETRGVINCENRKFTFNHIRDKNVWLNTHCCSWNFKICKFYTEQMKKYE